MKSRQFNKCGTCQFFSQERNRNQYDVFGDCLNPEVQKIDIEKHGYLMRRCTTKHKCMFYEKHERYTK